MEERRRIDRVGYQAKSVIVVCLSLIHILLITHRKGVLKYCDRELCIREGSVTEECSTTTICTA